MSDDTRSMTRSVMVTNRSADTGKVSVRSVVTDVQERVDELAIARRVDGTVQVTIGSEWAPSRRDIVLSPDQARHAALLLQKAAAPRAEKYAGVPAASIDPEMIIASGKSAHVVWDEHSGDPPFA